MHPSQMSRVVSAVPAAASTNATTLVIDTLAYEHASITVARAANAATAFATVLRLEESDDNVSYANVTGFVGGTDFTIPTVVNTNAVAVVKMDVDCRARRRYLRVQVTPNTSTAIPVAINCRLNRAETAPETAADAGCIGWVRG